MPSLIPNNEVERLTKKYSSTINAWGSVLVTGGMGDIGQLAGSWLADQSTRAHIWLLGRTGRSLGSAAVSVYRSWGSISMASGSTAACSDMAGICQLMVDVAAPAITFVLHAAAVLSDAVLSRQTAAGLRLVMAPKSIGALRVLSISQGSPLQQLVHFSSLTALMGNHGQANYAAANCVLDELSQKTLNHGLNSSSILWGPWALGLALKDSNTLQRLQKGGFGVISSKSRP